MLRLVKLRLKYWCSIYNLQHHAYLKSYPINNLRIVTTSKSVVGKHARNGCSSNSPLRACRGTEVYKGIAGINTCLCCVDSRCDCCAVVTGFKSSCESGSPPPKLPAPP